MNSSFILALSLLPRIGRKTIQKILAQNPNGIRSKEHLIDILRRKISETDISIAIEKAERILIQSTNLGIHSITPFDPTFPDYIKSIDDPPVLLFYQGEPSLLEYPKRIAIIGTRNPSTFGIEEGKFITKWFVENGYVILSGLAKGCDTVAHQGCLENGGKTIAILPCGIDDIYPPENQKLSEKIIGSGGLLLSEYPIDTTIQKRFFIERDRLQSGTSQAVVVIETPIQDGTMHTVNFALQQERVLGCIEYDHGQDIPQNQGNNQLIKTGQAFGLKRDNLSAFDKILCQKDS